MEDESLEPLTYVPQKERAKSKVALSSAVASGKKRPRDEGKATINQPAKSTESKDPETLARLQSNQPAKSGNDKKKAPKAATTQQNNVSASEEDCWGAAQPLFGLGYVGGVDAQLQDNKKVDYAEELRSRFQR